MDFEYRFCGGAAFTKEPCIFGSVYVLKEPSWHKEPFAIPTGTNSLGTTFVPRASESPSPRLPCGLNLFEPPASRSPFSLTSCGVE